MNIILRLILSSVFLATAYSLAAEPYSLVSSACPQVASTGKTARDRMLNGLDVAADATRIKTLADILSYYYVYGNPDIKRSEIIVIAEQHTNEKNHFFQLLLLTKLMPDIDAVLTEGEETQSQKSLLEHFIPNYAAAQFYSDGSQYNPYCLGHHIAHFRDEFEGISVGSDDRVLFQGWDDLFSRDFFEKLDAERFYRAYVRKSYAPISEESALAAFMIESDHLTQKPSLSKLMNLLNLDEGTELYNRILKEFKVLSNYIAEKSILPKEDRKMLRDLIINGYLKNPAGAKKLLGSLQSGLREMQLAKRLTEHHKPNRKIVAIMGALHVPTAWYFEKLVNFHHSTDPEDISGFNFGKICEAASLGLDGNASLCKFLKEKRFTILIPRDLF